jgi:electron transfer flavoprotein beta subunit
MKQVPDLVEELEIASSGRELDRSWMKFIASEYDDHALEQALILKERVGGTVRVMAVDAGDVQETLFTASAKGADEVTKITGDFESGIDAARAASLYAALLRETPFDLILTGLQTCDELGASMPALLAAALQLPYAGVVSGVAVDEAAREAVLRKEYPGGLLAEIAVPLPAVVGIQSAEKPPRYVPIAKIRQAMKTAAISETPAPGTEAGEAAVEVLRMFAPEQGAGAEILEGSPEDVASRIVAILKDRAIAR